MNLEWTVRSCDSHVTFITMATTSIDKERELQTLAALTNAHRKLKIEIGDLSDRLKVIFLTPFRDLLFDL